MDGRPKRPDRAAVHAEDRVVHAAPVREAWAFHGDPFAGPAEVDETYVGGKQKNMSSAKRKALAKAGVGRGTVGKTAVVGVKDRATNKVSAAVVGGTDAITLQSFVKDRVISDARVYTDELASYGGMPFFDHETVNHSRSEYVRGDAHTNGIESFWSMFRRAYHGTYHHISQKHLQRYVDQFAEKQSDRELGTRGQMRAVVAGMVGRRLLYRNLVA